MSIRAIKARVVCDQTTLEQLWRTHSVFNARLLPLIRILFQMRRGEVGSTDELRRLYQDIGLYVTNYSSQQADYFLNAISLADKAWRCSTPGRYKTVEIRSPDGSVRKIEFTYWVSRAIKLSTAKQLVFNKDELHGDLPGCMRQMLGREAVSIISGHDELTRIWHDDHQKWLKDKATWESEAEHQKYLAVRPQFDQFEQQVGGKIRQRRGRWHKYLEFLRSHPALAAWRGADPVVRDLDDAAKLRVQKARPTKRRSVEAEEFWKLNPELKALDRLHGDYEKNFARRGKTKRNADGFKHRPTFTEPNATLHPRWFVFNAPQTNPSGWSNLQLPATPQAMGSVSLILLTGDKRDGEFPAAKVPVSFKADPRLCDFRDTIIKKKTTRGKNKGQEVDKPAFVWRDRQLGIDRPATLGGIKLIFDLRADGTPAAAFLVFTCDIDNLPLSEPAKKVKSDFSDDLAKPGKKKFKGRTIPAGLISLAVDIGIRHVGFATLACWNGKEVGLLRSRNICLDWPETGSPDLWQIARHKRDLRFRRRKRGDPIKGEASHVKLQQHIDHMAEDRFKKAARAIVNLALNAEADIDKKTGKPYPRADVIILENLANLLPDAERERGINSALIDFNRGHLVEKVRQLADDAGLKVFEISPVGTSQVCHRCGALGRRYSIRREAAQKGRKAMAIIHFGPTESLFACPQCQALNPKRMQIPFSCNSDFNASVNLQRRFYHGDGALSAFGFDKAKRDGQIKEIEAVLEPRLRQLHGLRVLMGEAPW